MSKKQSRAIQTRELLIKAALETMRSHGIAGLTLEAVAREAGVSKGGLLHHFPSKEALIEGILQQLFADFEQRVLQYLDDEPPGAGRWLRAYIRATFDDNPLPLQLGAVLLSSALENPRLLTLIQDDFAHWQQRLLNDGVPPGRAMVIRQAADAYWTDCLMGVAPQDQATRLQLIDELLKLTQSTGL